MFERIILLAALIGASYWYWSGPYQAKINPDYEALLKKNSEDMALCMRGAAYQQGATGSGAGAEIAEENCAEKYNLYEYGGRWHSYDVKRPDQQ
ncbi:MAG: hypothetical protein DRQ65_07135 [Gammaproteobacteria bacterium]|nr:MAG: hypothetical protein DRQ65_07135 [Gammaproteobacteria bacterium]RLA53487.1 MAG: hypothetical protein DRQ98_08590 [Gammaproteobacteria bacterium]HDY82015.1 hypothetical protein [Halieaceae bacterium]